MIISHTTIQIKLYNLFEIILVDQLVSNYGIYHLMKFAPISNL